MKRLILAPVVLAAAALFAASALAHHSAAMFDTKTVVIPNAVVKEFQWTNPHAWLQVMVPTATGTEEWSLEMVALVGLERAGWKHGTLNPGDKVKVQINPMRDGTKGGRLLDITLPDGRVLSGQARPVGGY
ncbi:MAG TPA: DUF6152 family protein [Caulobacteraceae bacterium]|jgi:hypothetical protein|nr:DUF6152 family protein [Caulobacteraceae bacterium]